jgi:hypothetical protein
MRLRLGTPVALPKNATSPRKWCHQESCSCARCSTWRTPRVSASAVLKPASRKCVQAKHDDCSAWCTARSDASKKADSGGQPDTTLDIAGEVARGPGRGLRRAGMPATSASSAGGTSCSAEDQPTRSKTCGHRAGEYCPLAVHSTRKLSSVVLTFRPTASNAASTSARVPCSCRSGEYHAGGRRISVGEGFSLGVEGGHRGGRSLPARLRLYSRDWLPVSSPRPKRWTPTAGRPYPVMGPALLRLRPPIQLNGSRPVVGVESVSTRSGLWPDLGVMSRRWTNSHSEQSTSALAQPRQALGPVCVPQQPQAPHSCGTSSILRTIPLVIALVLQHGPKRIPARPDGLGHPGS